MVVNCENFDSDFCMNNFQTSCGDLNSIQKFNTYYGLLGNIKYLDYVFNLSKTINTIKMKIYGLSNEITNEFENFFFTDISQLPCDDSFLGLMTI